MTKGGAGELRWSVAERSIVIPAEAGIQPTGGFPTVAGDGAVGWAPAFAGVTTWGGAGELRWSAAERSIVIPAEAGIQPTGGISHGRG
ncbi:hypothetical protein [Chthonobacter rhizosphaerae]|uniref:hypothetical protein n=1 Tax=Chthonobacter rhizosphaerae TaxID=2735553 RepID=UPI0015EF2B68|nr:hypothetical protein [Chthonobacter rhizosphaerae]